MRIVLTFFLILFSINSFGQNIASDDSKNLWSNFEVINSVENWKVKSGYLTNSTGSKFISLVFQFTSRMDTRLDSTAKIILSLSNGEMLKYSSTLSPENIAAKKTAYVGLVISNTEDIEKIFSNKIDGVIVSTTNVTQTVDVPLQYVDVIKNQIRHLILKGKI